MQKKIINKKPNKIQGIFQATWILIGEGGMGGVKFLHFIA